MKKLLLILLLYAAPVSAQSFTVTAAPVPATTALCVFQMNSDNSLPICSTSVSGAANPALSNLASVAMNTAPLPATAGAISIGSATKPFGYLFFSGASSTPATNNFQIGGTSTGGTRTLTLADGNTTLVAGTMLSTTGTAADVTGLDVTAGQTLVVTTGGTLGSAAYTASSAYDVAGAAAAVTPTTLALVIGTNTQAWGAKLDAIQALASSAGCLSNNGSGVFSYASCGSAATESAITNDTTTNATMYPVWVTANTGSLPLKVSSTKMSFNPSTGTLVAMVFDGALDAADLTGTIAVARSAAIVTLTDGSTPALDASLGRVFRLSTTTAPTIAVPSNPYSGQQITIQFYASGAARTLALNTGTNGFRFGTDVTALTETASGKTDYIGAIWNATDSKWDVVAYVKGY